MALYPYLVAAHVTAVAFLVGGLFAQDRLVRSIARLAGKQPPAALAALLGFDRSVVTPALLLVWLSGTALAISAGWFASRWLLLKLAIVVALSAHHGVQSGRLRRCVRDGTPPQAMPFSGFGIPAAVLLIAVLAVAKPI